MKNYIERLKEREIEKLNGKEWRLLLVHNGNFPVNYIKVEHVLKWKEIEFKYDRVESVNHGWIEKMFVFVDKERFDWLKWYFNAIHLDLPNEEVMESILKLYESKV